MKNIFRSCIVFTLVLELLLVFSSCSVSEVSIKEDTQPYRKSGNIKYDEKLGQAYQIYDYNIVDVPGDNAVVIEFFFVTDYSNTNDKDVLFLRSGGQISNDEDRKDVPYNGEMHYSTLLGDGICSAVGVHISDAILTKEFKKKLEIDTNHINILEDDVYKVFRITEVYTNDNDINTIYILSGTTVYELTTNLYCKIDEDKIVFKLTYKHWE